VTPTKPVFGKETFQFFRELARNNRKAWMDENRERYQACIVQPLRRMLEELSPSVLRLNENFDVSGRTARISRGSTATSGLRKTRRSTKRRCT